jgi:hypothetical protein
MRITRGSWCMVVLALAALAVAGCKSTPDEVAGKAKSEPTGPHASLLKLFPSSGDMADWKPAGDAKVYGPAATSTDGVEPLAVDLGAGADVFAGYGYVKSATRKYVRGQGGDMVAVRIFEMKGPQDAFGVFSVSTSGTPTADLGLAARMKGATLAFVKSSYLVTIEYTGSGAAAQVLTEFGRNIAALIPASGYRPAILESFPIGSQPGEQYYLHTFKTLAALPFFPQGDAAALERALALSMDTEVAVVGYPTSKPGVLNYLFVIHYPTEADATVAQTAYDSYLQAATSQAEKNIALAPAVRAYVAGTLNAEENSVPGNDQLGKLLGSLGG